MPPPGPIHDADSDGSDPALHGLGDTAVTPPIIPLSKRLVLINSASAVAVKVLSVVVLGWVIQHLLKFIPDEELALLPIVLSLALLVPIVQRILTSGLGRFVTVAYSQGDHERIGRISTTFLPWLVGVGLLIFLAGLLLAWKIDWILSIPASLIPQARTMVIVTFLQFAICLSLGCLTTGIFALQRLYYRSAINTASSLFRIVLTLALIIGIGPQVQWVIIGQAAAIVLSTVACAVVSVRLLPSLLPKKFVYDREIAKDILSFGGWYSAGQLANTVRTALDAPLLHWLASPIAVNAFFLGSFVETQLRSLVNIAFTPIIPAISSMHAQGQQNRFASAYVRGGRLAVWAALLIGTPLIVFRYELLQLYLGENAVRLPGAETVMLLLLFNLALTLPATMLFPIGIARAEISHIIKRLLVGQTLNACLTLLFLGPLQLGAIGAASATLLASLFYHPFLFWPLGLRLAGASAQSFAIGTLARGWAPALVAGIAGLLIHEFASPTTLTAVITAGLIMVVVYLAVIVCCATHEDRADASKIFATLRRSMGRLPNVA